MRTIAVGRGGVTFPTFDGRRGGKGGGADRHLFTSIRKLVERKIRCCVIMWKEGLGREILNAMGESFVVVDKEDGADGKNYCGVGGDFWRGVGWGVCAGGV
jgi:hypothetical protein